MGCKPGWRVAVDLVDEIAQQYGGQLWDFSVGKNWDPGQAVCREAYGPDWMHSPEFAIADEMEEAPEEFLAAARRLLAGRPTWAARKEE